MRLKPLIRFIIIILVANSAYAATIGGSFANGEKYSAEYTVVTQNRSNEPRTKLLSIRVRTRNGDRYTYLYEAPAPPKVAPNALGFLSIIVNQGGMEGSRVYNQVFLVGNKLFSLGEIETTLHRGKIERIEIRKSMSLSPQGVEQLIWSVEQATLSEFSDPNHAYANAMLVLLAKSYVEHVDTTSARALLNNKEINEDAILVARLKLAICH